MISREWLKNIDEATFRCEVLIPLFKRMGFIDVHEHHWGPLEQGKDIVMWKPDPPRHRVNYAVVAKVDRITGAAGSGGEVLAQVRQALGAPFLDPGTRQERHVHHCFVYTTREVKKEGTNTLKSLLGSEGLLDRHVTVYDGDRLWEQIEEHMPQVSILAQLRSNYTELHGLYPEHQFEIRLRGGEDPNVRVYSHRTDAEPLDFSQHIESLEPDDPARLKLTEMLRSGAEHDFTQEELERLRMDQLAGPFLDLLPSDSYRVLPVLPATAEPLLASCRIEAVSDGRAFNFPYLELRPQVLGEETVELSNEAQPIPVTVTIRVARLGEGTSASLNFSWQVSGQNIFQLAQSIQAHRVLADECRWSLTDVRTGAELLPPMQKRLSGVEPPSPEFEDLVWRALEIQQKTNVLIPVPDREIFTDDDAAAIMEASHIIRNGKPAQAPKTNVLTRRTDVPPTRDFVEDLLSGKSIELKGNSPPVEVLGTEIPFGTVEARCEATRVGDEQRPVLEAWLEGEDTEIPEQIIVGPAAGHSIDVRYPAFTDEGNGASEVVI